MTRHDPDGDSRQLPDPVHLRDLAVAVATDAATVATDMRRDRLELETKSSATDMVTNADRAVERVIATRLAQARPGDVFLGEESWDPDAPPDPAPGTVMWVVDPIDGTTNYVYGYPGWGVSIAAEVDGRTVAGAIVTPSMGTVFDAASGHGARRNGAPLALSAPPPLEGILLATGFGYDPERRRRQGRLVAGLLPDIRDIRRMGAASWDFCAVAAQEVDAYYEEGLGPWDLAAGALIASEAGARVEGIRGGPARPEQPNLACHPDRWDELAALILDRS